MIWGIIVLLGLGLFWLINTSLDIWYFDDGWDE